MELRHLEHFVAVAEEQSFTRAAARIHLVQSALSVSIKSLEKELATRLFDRSTHRVELTDAGRALLGEARRTLAAADAARDAVAAVQGGLRGTIRLGIMHSLSLIDLAAIITRYRELAPQVRLVPVAAPGGSAELGRQVVDGRLDLAFAGLEADYAPGLQIRALAAEPMLLACPPGHRLTRRRGLALADVRDEPFIDFPRGWSIRTAVDRVFADAGYVRNTTVEVGDIPVLIELVRAGLGFAYVGASMLMGSRRPVLRRIELSPPFTVALLTPDSGRPPSAAAKAFIDIVLETYPG